MIISVLYCFCYFSIVAADYKIESIRTDIFSNPHIKTTSEVNISQSESESTPTTLPFPSEIPSPSPQSATRNDDWYFAYQPRLHIMSSQNDNFIAEGVNNIENTDDDCRDRNERGGLCRGKTEKDKEKDTKKDEKEKPQMMMNAMGKFVSKTKSKKCGNGKGNKMCNESTVPSIVPSYVPLSLSKTPENISTGAPNIHETDAPSITNVPSSSLSPTATILPSKIVLPTEYPTFQNTIPEVPSLPPNMFARTTSPTLVPTFTPSTSSDVRPSPIPTPTIDDALLRRATPFALTYGIMKNNTNDDDFGDIGLDIDSSTNSSSTSITTEHVTQVREVTIDFLVDYLNEQFFGNTETIVDYFVSNFKPHETNFTDMKAPSIVYGFDIVFADTTTFFLSREEIDILVESAFIAPFVDVLIATLQGLDTTNPFTSTTYISYTRQSDSDAIKDGRAKDDISSTDSPSNEAGVTEIYSETSTPVLIDEIGNQTSPPVVIDESTQSFDGMISQYEKSTVKVTPFSLTYQWIGDDIDPTIGETKAASNITLSFLDQYLHTMFDLGQPGTLNYFVGYSAGMIHVHDVIDYRTGLHFQDTTMFTNIQNEVDMLIQTAFIPHYVEPLIQDLRSKLPGTNPFSKTTAIAFEFTPFMEPVPKNGMSTLNIIALVMVILLLVILCILFALYPCKKLCRKRQRNVRGVPKIIIHANHDPIHGDLIEIVSSDDPDEDDIDRIHPGDGFASIFSSMHQRLMSPLPTIDDIGESTNYESNSSVSSKQYKTSRRSPTKSGIPQQQQSSDGWSSTSSSTSVLSIPDNTIPLKYTEPKIFEDID